MTSAAARLHSRPAAAAQQQARFDAFVEIYNHQRPHLVLAMRVQANLYSPRPGVLIGASKTRTYPFHVRAARALKTGATRSPSRVAPSNHYSAISGWFAEPLEEKPELRPAKPLGRHPARESQGTLDLRAALTSLSCVARRRCQRRSTATPELKAPELHSADDSIFRRICSVVRQRPGSLRQSDSSTSRESALPEA